MGKMKSESEGQKALEELRVALNSAIAEGTFDPRHKTRVMNQEIRRKGTRRVVQVEVCAVRRTYQEVADEA